MACQGCREGDSYFPEDAMACPRAQQILWHLTQDLQIARTWLAQGTMRGTGMTRSIVAGFDEQGKHRIVGVAYALVWLQVGKLVNIVGSVLDFTSDAYRGRSRHTGPGLGNDHFFRAMGTN